MVALCIVFPTGMSTLSSPYLHAIDAFINLLLQVSKHTLIIILIPNANCKG